MAGQTLSLAFEKANIDYILLEKHESFSPEAGASIGVFANGMRVMDQLGLCNAIESRTEPLTTVIKLDETGNRFDYSELLSKLTARYVYNPLKITLSKSLVRYI